MVMVAATGQASLPRVQHKARPWDVKGTHGGLLDSTAQSTDPGTSGELTVVHWTAQFRAQTPGRQENPQWSPGQHSTETLGRWGNPCQARWFPE